MRRVLTALLIPLCLFSSPNALRVRSGPVRGRREEFELVASAWASDIAPTRMDDELTVKVIVLPREQVIDRCRSMGAWEGGASPSSRQPAGCNRVYLDRKPMLCEVIVEEPRFDRDERMTTWGHEVYHCFRGRFH